MTPVARWHGSIVSLLFVCAWQVNSQRNVRSVGIDEWPMQYITAAPMPKRNVDSCPTDYTLCPASLDGGCCPLDRSCGTRSCFLTSANIHKVCGKVGYIACSFEDGGGCCPSGYNCNAHGGCDPAAGSSYSQDCGTASYLCPSSFGYGCCHGDLACGMGYCYITSYESMTKTVTYITTGTNSRIETLTTTLTSGYRPPTAQALPATTIASVATIATAVEKAAATSSLPSSSTGLTTAETTGIIVVVISVLIVILVATFLILRRLKKVSRRAEELAAARASKSSSGARSGATYKSSSHSQNLVPPPSSADIDHDSIPTDRLILAPQTTTHTSNRTGVPISSHIYSEYDHAIRPQNWKGGYQPIPLKGQYSQLASHSRNQSNQSTPDLFGNSPPLGDNATEYFSAPDPALRDQNLRFGHPPIRPSNSLHGRQWSDASEVSQMSDSSGVVELDAKQMSSRRSSVQQVMERLGLSRVGSRRSDNVMRRSSSGGILWQDVEMGAAQLSAPLQNVDEMESERLVVTTCNSGSRDSPSKILL